MKSNVNAHSNPIALPTTASLVKELLGAFMLQIIALSACYFLFGPVIHQSFDMVRASKEVLTWMMFIGSLLTAGFVLVFPLILIRQCLLALETARILDERGVLTDAYIMDKWVDDSDGRSRFCIRYSYLQHMNAAQTVNKMVFDRLTKGENVKVMILEQFPSISRMHSEMR